MVDEAKVTNAIREFCKNPQWNEVFTKAPAGAMERIAISFYFSANNKEFQPQDFDEYRALREEIEKTLDEEDLQYLIDNIGKGESVKHYKELLEKVKANGGPEKPAEQPQEGQQQAEGGEGQPPQGGEQQPPAEGQGGQQPPPPPQNGGEAQPQGEENQPPQQQ